MKAIEKEEKDRENERVRRFYSRLEQSSLNDIFTLLHARSLSVCCRMALCKCMAPFDVRLKYHEFSAV